MCKIELTCLFRESSQCRWFLIGPDGVTSGCDVFKQFMSVKFSHSTNLPREVAVSLLFLAMSLDMW